jgi:hypothetical protein
VDTNVQFESPKGRHTSDGRIILKWVENYEWRGRLDSSDSE